MNENLIIDVVRAALFTILKSSAPLLIVSLVVGLLISVIQTVTSIQEQTLTFVPKLIAIFLVLMLIGNWILNNMTAFAVELFSNFKTFIN